MRCLRSLSRRSLPLGGGVLTFDCRASEGLAPKVRNGEARMVHFLYSFFYN